MRAIVQDRYGGPEVLSVADLERPVPGADDVLVRVRAASLNARDWHVLRGDPWIARWMDRATFGRTAPKTTVRGTDFAGVVESVGSSVREFRVGDTVYGEADGAFAEYVCAPATAVDHVPAGLSLEQAAALPLAANTALVCLETLRAGQRVLILGASGGVGTFAVQIAAARGADVTAVCSTRNVELVTSLGASRVIDYTTEPITGTYDVVVDLVGARPLSALRRVLSTDGTLVLSGGGVSSGGSVLGPLKLLMYGQLVGLFVRQRIIAPLAKPNREAFAEIRRLIESGDISPAVDRVYPLVEVSDAIRYLETEHAKAKVVITV